MWYVLYSRKDGVIAVSSHGAEPTYCSALIVCDYLQLLTDQLCYFVAHESELGGYGL